MQWEPQRNWGCIVAAALFATVGVPLLALMSLGERVCDTVPDNPCGISWGLMQIIYCSVVLAICLAVGWLVNRVLRRPDPNE